MANLRANLACVVRAGLRPREPRVRVHAAARMKAGSTWHDILILNISSRGLMARSKSIPAARSYVEIRLGTNAAIIGKVIWHDDEHFGIRTQDRIDISMISGNGCGDAAAKPSPVFVERRARVRAEDPVEAFERSQRIAGLQQFGAIVVAGGLGAMMLTEMVRTIFAAPIAEVVQHL